MAKASKSTSTTTPRSTRGKLAAQKVAPVTAGAATSSATITATKPPRPRKRAAAAAVTHEQIARRAYAIWQARGCPAGQEAAHWYEAERELGVK